MDAIGSTYDYPIKGGRTNRWGGWWTELKDREYLNLFDRYPEWHKKVTLSDFRSVSEMLPIEVTPVGSKFLSHWPHYRMPYQLRNLIQKRVFRFDDRSVFSDGTRAAFFKNHFIRRTVSG